VVSPTAWWVTDNVGYERLVLSACTPLFSAAKRIVVFARLAAVVPVGLSRLTVPVGRAAMLEPVRPTIVLR
jgi:hypothetical protein